MGKHLLCGSWCESLFSFPICSRSCIQDSPLDGQGWLLSFHSGATSPNRNWYTLAEGFCTASLTVMEVHLRCVCFSWVQDPHEVSLEKLLAGLKNWVFQVLLLSRSVVSDSVQAHRWQPTRLCHPWDSPGKNTGVGCHFCLQCRKVKSESEVTQSCPTLRDPHGLQPTRLLRPWDFPGKSTGVGAIAFSGFSGGSDFNTGLSTFPSCETMEKLLKPLEFWFHHQLNVSKKLQTLKVAVRIRHNLPKGPSKCTCLNNWYFLLSNNCHFLNYSNLCFDFLNFLSILYLKNFFSVISIRHFVKFI